MYHLVIWDLSEGNLPSLAVTIHVSSRYWFTGQVEWSGMLHHYCQTNRQVSTSRISLNQPWHKETVLESLSATKKSNLLVSSRCWLLFSECTIHYTDPTRSVSTFSVVFVIGMYTAAVSQLFSTNVGNVYVWYSIYNWSVYGCSSPAVFN